MCPYIFLANNNRRVGGCSTNGRAEHKFISAARIRFGVHMPPAIHMTRGVFIYLNFIPHMKGMLQNTKLFPILHIAHIYARQYGKRFVYSLSVSIFQFTAHRRSYRLGKMILIKSYDDIFAMTMIILGSYNNKTLSRNTTFAREFRSGGMSQIDWIYHRIRVKLLTRKE